MYSRFPRRTCGVLFALVAVVPAMSAKADQGKFTLAGAIPNDVFVYSATASNPERDFLNEYWGEVFDALRASGIGEDAMELIGSLLDERDKAEVERLKALAEKLIDGVNWEELAGKEFVFAERMSPPIRHNGGVHMGPPDMVLIFRGSDEGVASNYKGLVAILEAAVGEINKAAFKEGEGFVLERSERMGAKTTGVNLFSKMGGVPPMNVCVTQRGDLVILSIGNEILDEVLGLLSGNSTKGSLASSEKFKRAFAALPAAEDNMVLFDMHAMIAPFEKLLGFALNVDYKQSSKDVYFNVSNTGEAHSISSKMAKHAQKGEIREALKVIQEGLKEYPGDSRMLYNVACMHSLLGEKEEALTYLEKSVKAGMYAPGWMKQDPDLENIRSDERYKAALAEAEEMANRYSASDKVINSERGGEAFDLCMKAWKVYEQKDYAQGLELVQKAHELAPTDSRVLYYLSCFYALTGDKQKALDYLEKSVEGGFYSHGHIAHDPDLASLRSDERYAKALALAAERASSLQEKKSVQEEWRSDVHTVVTRLLKTPQVVDFIATVGYTDGYSTRTETVVALAADAKENPIYPVFGERQQVSGFDRYLPKETVSFSVGSGIDVNALYKFIVDTVKAAGPEGQQALAKWDVVQTEIGVNIENDVLSWIEGSYVSASLEGGGGLLMLKVNDEQKAKEKVSAALNFLATELPKYAAQNPMLAMYQLRKMPVKNEKLEGFESLYIGMTPQPVIWGVADGYLIFGVDPDAVVACLETAKGNHPSIRQNTRVMSEALVPTGKFSDVSLTDQRMMGQEMGMALGMISMGGGMMSMAIPDPDARVLVAKVTGMLSKLSPVVAKIDFYKSTARVTTYDGQYWRSRTVTHYASPEERAGKKADVSSN